MGKGETLRKAMTDLKTAEPGDRLEKLTDIAGAIGEMYSAVEKASQGGKSTPVFTIEVGVEQRPSGENPLGSEAPEVGSSAWAGAKATIHF
jgi:hypothetical protein